MEAGAQVGGCSSRHVDRSPLLGQRPCFVEKAGSLDRIKIPKKIIKGDPEDLDLSQCTSHIVLRVVNLRQDL